MTQADAWRPRVDMSLGAQFVAVARSRADAVALMHRDERLTYAELEQRSATLAVRIAQACQPGSLVGICLPIGVDAVVAIVATIRAERAYVPLDPTYPAERLRYLIGDARLAAVVMSTDTRHLVHQDVVAIDVDAAQDGVAMPATALPPSEPAMDTPAYVIYTSGSSGLPKGVVVSHANVVALLSASTISFSFGPDDIWSLFHSISFDFSVWEIWGALLHGARLVVVDNDVKMAPDRVVELLHAEQVTVFNVVPSVFREIATEFAGHPRELALRYIIFGGEPIHLPSVSGFRTACTQPVTFVNMYGITETTVHVTARILTVDDERATGVSPIGVALQHLEVRLTDEEMRPVPDGAVGEMCVAGDGVALGYLRRPELDAERFVWIEDAGTRKRFYRSGDLARRNSRGELEYVGRSDHQVKIHGFRIELGEIEASLEALPAVAAAAVVVEQNSASEPILVGYVVPRQQPPAEGSRALARALRAALLQVLPRHMVPGRLVTVSALPHTVSGKLDRASLSNHGCPDLNTNDRAED